MAMSLFGKKDTQAAPKQAKPNPPGVTRGSLLVTGLASVNNEYSWQGIWITGVLTGLGMKPCAVLFEGRANSNKWPEMGQTLPVTMKQAEPSVVAILWDEVPDPKDVGLERAKKLALSMSVPTSQGSTPPPEV
jgi:hypothetical protein